MTVSRRAAKEARAAKRMMIVNALVTRFVKWEMGKAGEWRYHLLAKVCVCIERHIVLTDQHQAIERRVNE